MFDADSGESGDEEEAVAGRRVGVDERREIEPVVRRRRIGQTVEHAAMVVGGDRLEMVAGVRVRRLVMVMLVKVRLVLVLLLHDGHQRPILIERMMWQVR